MHGWQTHNGLLREIRMFVVYLESSEVIMIVGKHIPQNIPTQHSINLVILKF